MNYEYLELCKKEIQDLLSKDLIRKSYSPWSCTAFYVNKASEKERGVPRLVINYKPLNDVLKWIRYPIPNKKDLLDRLFKSWNLFKIWLKIWILADSNPWKGQIQNCFYSPIWPFWMECYAIWVEKCSIRILKYHEWDFHSSFWVLYCLYRWHFNFIVIDIKILSI